MRWWFAAGPSRQGVPSTLLVVQDTTLKEIVYGPALQKSRKTPRGMEHTIRRLSSG
jgi:hypothetical protein